MGLATGAPVLFRGAETGATTATGTAAVAGRDCAGALLAVCVAGLATIAGAGLAAAAGLPATGGVRFAGVADAVIITLGAGTVSMTTGLAGATAVIAGATGATGGVIVGSAADGKTDCELVIGRLDVAMTLGVLTIEKLVLARPNMNAATASPKPAQAIMTAVGRRRGATASTSWMTMGAETNTGLGVRAGGMAARLAPETPNALVESGFGETEPRGRLGRVGSSLV